MIKMIDVVVIGAIVFIWLVIDRRCTAKKCSMKTLIDKQDGSRRDEDFCRPDIMDAQNATNFSFRKLRQ